MFGNWKLWAGCGLAFPYGTLGVAPSGLHESDSQEDAQKTHGDGSFQLPILMFDNQPLPFVDLTGVETRIFVDCPAPKRPFFDTFPSTPFPHYSSLRKV